MNAQAETDERDLVTFVSGDRNLRLVKVPIRPRMSPEGVLIQLPGETVEFRNGLLRVDEDNDESGVLEFLRNHEQYQVLFHEQGNEPGRVEDASSVLAAIIDAAVEGDVKALEEIYVNERASFSRPEVLKAAARAIEQVSGDEDAVPDPPPTPVHQLERRRDATVQTEAGFASVAQIRGEEDGQGNVIVDEAPEATDGPQGQPVVIEPDLPPEAPQEPENGAQD